MDDLDIGAAATAIGESLGFGNSGDNAPDSEVDVGEGGVGRAAPAADAPEGQTASAGVTAKAPVAADPSAKPPADAKAAAAPPADGAPTPPPGPPAPKTWRPEAQAKWDTLDPVIKAEVQKREEDTLRGLGQYKQAAQAGETFQKVIQPFTPLLRQYNVDPIANVSSLLQTQAALVQGSPEQKVEVLRNLAKAYQVDLAALDPASAPYVDPAVERLQSELQGLKSQLQSVQTAKVSEVQTQLRSEIDTFFSDASNIYADEVANDMAKLLQAGAAGTLKEAYETAIWANPQVRAKEMARLSGEATVKAKAEAEAAAQAAAARTAAARQATGVNVRSVDRLGSVSAPKGSMDETLQSAYEAIMARG